MTDARHGHRSRASTTSTGCCPAIVRGETAPHVVDMLNCEGCIDGPAVNTDLSVFAKRNLIAAERERQPPPAVDSRSFLGRCPPIDLWRSFEPQPALTRVPTAEEIDAVLAAGEFASRAETIDCGACGYSTPASSMPPRSASAHSTLGPVLPAAAQADGSASATS